MKVETNMCRFDLRARNKLIGLAIALLGLLTQLALVNICLAQSDDGKSSDGQLTATMPDTGAPPAPATTSAAEVSTPAQLGDAGSELSSDEATTETGSAAAATPDATASTPTTAVEKGDATDSQTGKANEARTEVEVEVRELSVSPESKPLLPEGRPAWVSAPPDLSNPRRHRLFVGSFPSSSIEEVDAALDEPLLAAVNGYIDEQVLEGGGADELDISSDFIRHNLLDRSTEYLAELSTSTGPLYQKWVVLEITPEHRKYFAEAYRQVEQKNRMAALGLGLAGLMGITGVAHLAFNRRRRRYAPLEKPVVHTLLHEPDPRAAKPTSRALWLIIGGVGCVAIVCLFLLASVTIVHRARSVHSMSVSSGPRVIIHGEPPAPPIPPQPPEVHFDSAAMDNVIQAQRETANRLHDALDSAEVHRRMIELRSEGD